MSGQGNGLGGYKYGCGCSSVLHLAALLASVTVLFVVLVVASCAMAPRETNPPDPDTVNACAEVDNPPQGCEP